MTNQLKQLPPPRPYSKRTLITTSIISYELYLTQQTSHK